MFINLIINKIVDIIFILNIVTVYTLQFIYSNNLLNYLFFYFLNNQFINILILIIIILIQLQSLKKILLIFIYIYANITTFFNVFKLKVEMWPEILLLGLNNLHPLIYYVSLVTLFKFCFNKIIFYNYLKLFYIYVGWTLSLLTGMYWGSINSVWTYFWVNDGIELFLFLMWCWVTYLIHTYTKNFINIFLTVWLYALFYLLLIRWNLIASRHSFFAEITNYSYSLYLVYILSFFNIFVFNINYSLMVLVFAFVCLNYSILLLLVIFGVFIHNITFVYLYLLHIASILLTVNWLIITPNFNVYIFYIKYLSIPLNNIITTISINYDALYFIFSNKKLTLLTSVNFNILNMFVVKNILYFYNNILTYCNIFIIFSFVINSWKLYKS